MESPTRKPLSMSSENQIEATGEILGPLSHGGYRARLANGHVCIARTMKKDAAAFVFNLGDPVRLAFHPADLSRARILGPARRD